MSGNPGPKRTDGKRRWSRREFLRSASLASFGTIAATRGGGSFGRERAAKTINWWPGWTGDYMPQVARAFEQAHPGVHVNVGNFYPTAEKLLTAIAGGDAPDIVSDINYYYFIASGLVIPLDRMIHGSSHISFKDMRPVLWANFKWAGKHYGIPCVDTSGKDAIAYNLSLVEKAGLDPRSLPETWDEVFTWHKKLTKFGRGGNLQTLGLDPLSTAGGAIGYGAPWIWAQMWNFHYFNEKTFTYHIDRPETVEIFDLILKFYDYVGVQKITSQARSSQTFAQGAFGAGEQAMLMTWQNGAAAVHDTDPKQHFKFTWLPMPSHLKGRKLQTPGGHAYVIMKSSQLKKEAFRLAVFTTEDKAANILFKGGGWFSPRTSWLKTADLSIYPKEVQENLLFYVDYGSSNDLWTFVKDPLDANFQNYWTNVTSQLTNHSISPKGAAKFLQSKLTSDMKSSKSKFALR